MDGKAVRVRHCPATVSGTEYGSGSHWVEDLGKAAGIGIPAASQPARRFLPRIERGRNSIWPARLSNDLRGSF